MTEVAKTKSTSDKNKAFKKAVAEFVNDEHLGDFNYINTPQFSEKLGVALNKYILETINDIQTNEVNNDYSKDAYPAENYYLLNDTPANNTKKKNVNFDSAPKKRRLPRKKGETVPDEDENDDEDEDNTHKDDEEPEEVEEKTEVVDKPKPKPKKKITQVQKSARMHLLFLVNRFIYEVYSTEDGNNVENSKEFSTFVLTNIPTELFASQICRTVIPVYDKLHKEVFKMNDHKLASHLDTAFDGLFNDRQNLGNYVKQYIVTYIKLLGVVLGNQVWTNRTVINAHNVEAAMRVLNTGVHEYLVNAEVCGEDDNDHGLLAGILSRMNSFEQTALPPAPKTGKKKKTAEPKKTEESNKVKESDEESEEEEQTKEVRPIKASKKPAVTEEEPAKPSKKKKGEKAKGKKKSKLEKLKTVNRINVDDSDNESNSDNDETFNYETSTPTPKKLSKKKSSE